MIVGGRRVAGKTKEGGPLGPPRFAVAWTLLVGIASSFLASPAGADDFGRFNLLDFASGGSKVDRTGAADVSQALDRAVAAANAVTAKGRPGCIYIPAGIYRVRSAPPPLRARRMHRRRRTDPIDHSPRPELRRRSLRLVGGMGRDDVGSHGHRAERRRRPEGEKPCRTRSSFTIVTTRSSSTTLRSRTCTAERFIPAPLSTPLKPTCASRICVRSASSEMERREVPVVEFCSRGTGATDATNEIRMSQVDIYGSNGPSFVIRNNGDGVVRDITADELRIEGKENGTTAADLLTLGDPTMRGNVNNITFDALELLDPYKGFAALRMTAAAGAPAPYQITVAGEIGGGLPRGQGLRIDAGRSSIFRMSGIHTLDTNVVIGRGVSQIVLDGGGQERNWTYRIDPTSLRGIAVPLRREGDPSKP